MISFGNLLLTESLNSMLICNPDECLSFIIVFLNLLTIFYLVYSSYKKITKITRLFGYIWSCFIMCASVVVLALHTCIFTIGGTIFTGMAIIAVLSMIFENKKEQTSNQSEPEVVKKDVGCYVIFPTDDNAFVFGLHNKSNQLLAMSKYKYHSVEDAKDAISIAKISGSGCEFEDLTQDWVIDAKHPKFKMFLNEQKYFFELAVNKDLTILKSEGIDDASTCLKMVKDARKCVTSNVIYFATSKDDIKIGDEYNYYSMNEVNVADTDVPETKTIEEKVPETKVEETNTNEEKETEARSLAESLKEIENAKSSSNINKQTLYEYLNNIYGKAVILNRRDNKTKTGLALADTYYTYYMQEEDGKPVKKKVCFAYVYENDGACLILVRLDKSYVKELKKNNKSIMQSKFPKSKTWDWYSVVVNDTYTEDEIYQVLESAKKYCEG